ncbi:Gfo/Idh/MocA family protein [Rufibacter hautae]|uniref:Gfo/Idh/MocA family oxidoreductase n=1 Tax=Rufibacter hautae TaxID=2595005 RepID=A0A5B6TDR4_9BACT|nr:Gfo/Idh/MocA family oxidoreductase [Rufibacter hautae]KAA3438288.1 Gfo/Idh/MocA family oxidoreductase [Rufibacter hautae]
MFPLDRLLTLVPDEFTQPVSRKSFLQMAGKGMAAGVVGGFMASCQTTKTTTGQASEVGSTNAPTGQNVPKLPAVSPPAQVPSKPDEPIKLEAWKSDADRQSGPTPTPMPPDQRVGYALVGLGHLTLEELLPAFGQCKKSKPVALVSGSPEKMRKVAQQYGIKPENCYSYETYDQLKDNPEVQVIYIVLPNALHAEYTIRGAKAGKHILCEKPMANSSAECQAMIDACRKANRKLMVAYRIQYEPYNRHVRQLVQDKKFGEVKFIEAFNCQSSANPQHWRHKKALAGGGALPDIGLYCLNTLRFLLGTEPTEVSAYQYSTPGNPLFKEVEELMSWQMKFPNGIYASCATHYNTHESRRYRVLCERGWINMDPAFSYTGQQMKTSRADGMLVRKEDIDIAHKNQFATEMDHFSECVLKDLTPYTPGEEGLQDHRIMEAIYHSAKEGRSVKLPAVSKKDAFRGPEPKLE